MASDLYFYALKDESGCNSLINDTALLAVWGEYVKDWRYKLMLMDRALEDLYYDKIYKPSDALVDLWLEVAQVDFFLVGSTGHKCQTVDKMIGRFGYKKLILTPKLAKYILSFYDETETEFTGSVYRLCTKPELEEFLLRNIYNWIYGRSE
jgi:hypothetical protein